MIPDGPAKVTAAFAYYPRLQRVKEYVERHYAGDIPLRDVARVARLEQKYFSAYFRAKTGMCFRDWLTQQRIDQAKHMMTAQDHSITEVAFAVGYRDLRTFQRAFKKCTGMTPRTYRSTVQP